MFVFGGGGLVKKGWVWGIGLLGSVPFHRRWVSWVCVWRSRVEGWSFAHPHMHTPLHTNHSHTHTPFVLVTPKTPQSTHTTDGTCLVLDGHLGGVDRVEGRALHHRLSFFVCFVGVGGSGRVRERESGGGLIIKGDGSDGGVGVQADRQTGAGTAAAADPLGACFDPAVTY